MSDPENVFARWSRLKREKAQKDGESAATDGDTIPDEAEAAVATPAQLQSQDPPLDVSTLPPIDSIVAGSDVKAFLQAGVPAQLARAALRRAWVADPAIRDFIEMAENQWDFTDPGSIPGFGPLTSADDIPRLVAQALGKLPLSPPEVGTVRDEETRPTALSDAPAPRCDARAEAPSLVDANQDETLPLTSPDEISKEEIATQHDLDSDVSTGKPARRSHGKALPQ
jgi:hypothetical protein